MAREKSGIMRSQDINLNMNIQLNFIFKNKEFLFELNPFDIDLKTGEYKRHKHFFNLLDNKLILDRSNNLKNIIKILK